MIWPVFLSLFWAGILTAYISVAMRKAELLFGGISLLCWLGVAFSATSIQVEAGGELETVGEPGITAIGAFGTIALLVWIIMVVADRVPVDVEADHNHDTEPHEQQNY